MGTKLKLAGVLFFALLSTTCLAEFVRVPYEGIRAVGMGNAFIALSDDSNVLFYNPAALARVKGMHINLLDLTLGMDPGDTISRLQKALFDGNYRELFRTGTEFAKFSAKFSITTPYFGLSVYDNLHSQTKFNNFEGFGGDADIYSFNDLGVIAGIGIPFGNFISAGASVRVFQRAGGDFHLNTNDLIAQAGTTPEEFQAAIYDNLKKIFGAGYAVGLNLGVQVDVPLPAEYPRWRLAATVEDVGQTTFRPLASANSVSVPAPQRTSYNFGSVLTYNMGRQWKFNLALDMRNVFDDILLSQMTHFGMEIRHRFVSFRGGLYQGYVTYGLSLEVLPHTKLHLASYAVEMQRGFLKEGQRWYLAQVIIGFDPL